MKYHNMVGHVFSARMNKITQQSLMDL